MKTVGVVRIIILGLTLIIATVGQKALIPLIASEIEGLPEPGITGVRETNGNPSLELVGQYIYDDQESVLPRRVAAANQYVYLTTISDVHIISVSDPSQPHEIGVYDVSGEAPTEAVVDIIIKGASAYVATLHGGLRIIFVDNPKAIREIGSFPMPGRPASSVEIINDYAYISTQRGQLIILNISNPVQPVEVGSTVGKPRTIYESVTADNEFAFLANKMNSLHVVSVINASNPEEVAVHDYRDVPYGDNANYGEKGATDVVVGEGYAYVAYSTGGLIVFDVSSPVLPRAVGYLDTGGVTSSIAMSGRYVYLADRTNRYYGDGGLRAVDVSDPAHPYETDFFVLPRSRAVTIDDGYVYVADEEDGLYIFRDLAVDARPPQEPIATENPPGIATSPANASGAVGYLLNNPG